MTTKTMSIAEIVGAFAPLDEFDDVLIKLGNAFGYRQNDECQEFLFSKYRELDMYITWNSTSNPPMASEIPMLIKQWMTEQEKLADLMIKTVSGASGVCEG